MANVVLHDYNDNYKLTPVYYAALKGVNLNSGTYYDSYNDVTWTVTKTVNTTYGSIRYQITQTEKQLHSAAEVVNGLLELGLDFVGIEDCNYGYENVDKTLGSGIVAQLAPYIRLNITQTTTALEEPIVVGGISYFFQNHWEGTTYPTQFKDAGYIFHAPIMAIADNETAYYGCLMGRAAGAQNMGYEVDFFYSTDINDTNFSDYEEPGEKGFAPTGANTSKNRPGVGGRGSTNKKDPDYKSDDIFQPGAPNESTASAIGSGFLTCYKISQSNLEKVGRNLYGDTLLDIIKNISVNPLDFIVSLMVFPCAPASVGGSTNIKLGGWLCAASGGGIINALGENAEGNPLAKQFRVVNFGTIQIPENWGNFLDYSQTTIELYLPFIGSVNIDVSECMGGSINVQYTIDFFTGMCVANILCKRSFPLPSGKFIPNNAQHAYQGNCAIQIPLSAINYGNMVGSLINACTQGITNPVQGFAGIASDAVAGGFRPNVSSKGNIVANSGFCSVLYPYVRITRPITAEPDSYQEVMGYPSYINTTLGQCQDLCICDDIDLRGLTGATEQELNKIRQLCKEGVYV